MKKLLMILFLLAWYFIYAEYHEPSRFLFKDETSDIQIGGETWIVRRGYDISYIIKTTRKNIRDLDFIKREAKRTFEKNGYKNIKSKYISIKCISKL